jgi:hypothetical protein
MGGLKISHYGIIAGALDRLVHEPKLPKKPDFCNTLTPECGIPMFVRF